MRKEHTMNNKPTVNISEMSAADKRKAIEKIIKALQNSQGVNWGS
jgi:hypothetical protein